MVLRDGADRDRVHGVEPALAVDVVVQGALVAGGEGVDHAKPAAAERDAVDQGGRVGRAERIVLALDEEIVVRLSERAVSEPSESR